MRVSAERLVSFLRGARLPVMGMLAIGALLTGCGDKTSNPDAVTVDELKYPGNLVAMDKGNGEVWLSWTGANNEKDFDGYNVYGMAGKAADLGVTDGKAIELLDASGSKVPDATNVLGNFNYDPKVGLAKKGDAQGSGSGSDAPEFSALPIHNYDTDGTTRLLPTCKPKAGTCAAITADNKATADTTAGDDANYAVNGTVNFKVPGPLTVGQSYCFFVMASENNGKKVSQTSSNAVCVVPKFKADFKVTLPGVTTPIAGTENEQFDLRAFLTACGTQAAGTACPDPTAGTKTLDLADDSARTTGNKREHVATDAMPLYIETSSTGAVGLVAGKRGAINDLGFYADGFNDATLGWVPPTLVIDEDKLATGSSKDGPIFNAGGYSVPGQTIPLVQKHVYVVAVGTADGTEAKGPFNYHWIYVEKAPAAGEALTLSMLLTKDAQ